MKRKIAALFFVAALLFDVRPASAAIFDYSVIICGIPTALGFWTARMYPPGAVATIGAAVACTAAYYGMVAVAQSGVLASLTDEQAKMAIHENKQAAQAASVFGQESVVKFLKLPAEQQTEENMAKILVESLEGSDTPPEA